MGTFTKYKYVVFANNNYRKKFLDMADRLATQIEYDYDAALEKCQKKWQKKEKENDIGEDALVLALKKAPKQEEKK